MSGMKGPREMIQILDATRMTMPELAKALAVERAAGLVSTDPPSVTAFTAVESLGLELESRRLSVDTVVIDKIERVPRES